MTPVLPASDFDSSNNAQTIVYIVDDEPMIRASIQAFLETEGLKTKCYSSGQEFLDSCSSAMQGCVLLDLFMPGCSGLELQKELARRDVAMPVIFLTGHGTVPTSSEAFRTGAFDFLEKPFDNELLLQRVSDALTADDKRRAQSRQKQLIAERYGRLSERERQVLEYIVNGYSSKETAKNLGISHRTVEIYRAHIMRKMNSDTLAELIRVISPLMDEQGAMQS